MLNVNLISNYYVNKCDGKATQSLNFHEDKEDDVENNNKMRHRTTKPTK